MRRDVIRNFEFEYKKDIWYATVTNLGTEVYDTSGDCLFCLPFEADEQSVKWALEVYYEGYRTGERVGDSRARWEIRKALGVDPA